MVHFPVSEMVCREENDPEWFWEVCLGGGAQLVRNPVQCFGRCQAVWPVCMPSGESRGSHLFCLPPSSGKNHV